MTTTTETKERPIIMQTQSAREILSGRKTQTRRLSGLDDLNAYDGRTEGTGSIGPLGYRGLCPSDLYVKDKLGYRREPERFHWVLGEREDAINPIPLKCPYGRAGDRLWVREAWSPKSNASYPYNEDDGSITITYADGATKYVDDYDDVMGDWTIPAAAKKGPLTPLFMPRWASRLTLEIVEVRVERVQDISDADVIAEGSFAANQHMLATQPRIEKNCRMRMHAHRTKGVPLNDSDESRRADFAILWDSVNAARGFPWSANPWVWVVSFRRIEQ